ncbi:ATP-binding protein [Gloeobacter kilaueensis]|uniref:Circadian input-output histidine kinase CikA n=1 Tax=Gloeobacter kilaueensis (strain ATCC BAA-2537 / CCAP 1431/1 / ULC 316 / JS1) TaxID=1183438 RepID=U5QJ30_GLOK1|nr:ATP-binding protein [Gloeobacter kilaueensis]AGY58916.1 multi-sensor hybrid histidine kinase [Gloeobacter kilaueensis JS1]
MNATPVEPVSILLVDDRSENLLALQAVLGGLGQNLVTARSAQEALRCVLRQDFALILLDVQMPGMDGFEAARLIRSRPRSHSTPIIFLTAYSSSDSLVFRGYSLGAVDYLFKPIDPAILVSKVSVFVELFQRTAEVQRQAQALSAMNDRLLRSEERLIDFLDNAGDLIQIVTIEGRLLYVNQSWQRTLGYQPADIEAITCFDVVLPEERAALVQLFERLQDEPASRRIEVTLLSRNGRAIPTEGSFNCRFEDGKLQAIRCIFHDLSERRQIEEARAQALIEQMAREQAEAASRTKDEFLAMVSHELRTPLNAVLGWSQLLLRRRLDEAATERALDAIERNARLQLQLVEDLLDISRIVTGKLHLDLRPVNLSEVLEFAMGTIRSNAEARQIQLHNPSAGSALHHYRVMGDSNRLSQVFWNLLSNAVKFTPNGGSVEVSLLRSTDTVTINVSDTGIGIRPEFLPHVFERFRQADSSSTRQHGGLGLGLAIVRHLVELHGGTIAVTSGGEGQGTTFTVELPALGEPQEHPACETTGSPQASHS